MTEGAHERFLTLLGFAGGPTATAESDFSIMNRQTLQDLAIEGILQCKQFNSLKQFYGDMEYESSHSYDESEDYIKFI